MSDQELRRLERMALHGGAEERQQLELYRLRHGLAETKLTGPFVLIRSRKRLRAFKTLAFRTGDDRRFLAQRHPPRLRVDHRGRLEALVHKNRILERGLDGEFRRPERTPSSLAHLGGGPLPDLFLRKSPPTCDGVPFFPRMDQAVTHTKAELHTSWCDVMEWSSFEGPANGDHEASTQKVWLDLDGWIVRYELEHEYPMGYGMQHDTLRVDYFDYEPDVPVTPLDFMPPPVLGGPAPGA